MLSIFEIFILTKKGIKQSIYFRLIYFFVLVFCAQVTCNNVHGQSELNHVVFPSPNAYSLAKYVEAPVNYYTGIPEIKIPIYNISSSQLQSEINLSYHAGGVKVNDFPSWVGSGWSLNAGGVITRAVSGLNDDELSKGFYYTGHLLNNDWPHPSGNYVESHRVGLVDGMPDMFYFNFNGHSGKFFFDNNGDIRTLPYTNIKIELTETSTINKNFGPIIFGFSGFKKWKVTDENGVIYYFEELELSKSETAVFQTGGGFGDVKDLVTSWYLTKIVSPNLENEIVFEYDYSNFDTSSSLYEFHAKAIGYYTHHGSSIPSSGSLTHLGSFAENKGQTISRNYRHNLKRIIFQNGSVEFFTSIRNDLPHSSMEYGFYSYKLDSILVKDNLDAIKRKYILKFINNPTQRLTLKQVIVDNDKIYSFDYYNLNLLPEYTSKNTDHWGYFNGASNNGSGLIPTFSYTSQSYQDITYPGINKGPDSDKMKYGILNKITWPTGGFRHLYYEPNEYSFLNDQPLAENGWSSWNYINSSTTPSVTFGSLAQVQLWHECSTDGIAYGNNIEPCLSVLTPWNFNFSGTFDLTKYIPEYTGEIDVIVKLKYRLLEPGSITKKIGGGIRISEIHNVDILNPPVVKKFGYTQEGNNNLSSGVSGSDFKYHVPFVSGNPSNGVFATGVKAYSYSAYPLSTTQSRHIGYQRVTEQIIGNGETIYQFTSFYDYPDQIGLQNNPYEMPLIPKKSNEHKRGKPIIITQKDNSGNILATNRTAGFKTLTSGQTTKVWQTSPFISFILGFGNNGSLPNYWQITLAETTAYTIDSESFLPGFEIKEAFSQDAVYKVEKTSSYNLFHQLKSRLTFNSDEKFYREEYKYPKEYSSPSSEISNLLAKNIIGDPIESIHFGEMGAFKGTAKKWKLNSGNVLIDEILELETSTPIKTFSYSTNGVSFSNSFVKKSKIGYDLNLNVNKIEEKGNYVRTILWDYKHELPVCEVRNAEPNTVSYTSFETVEKGGWDYSGSPGTSPISKTGSRYYDLGTGSISKSGISASTATKFRLTFWARRSIGSGNWTFMGQTEVLGTAWKLIEREVTNSTTVTIAGSGIYVDELRLHPASALMTTYTYDPLVGMKTMTDARNYTMYYDYDALGRLKTIKDENGQIKEHYEYNYRTSGFNP